MTFDPTTLNHWALTVSKGVSMASMKRILPPDLEILENIIPIFVSLRQWLRIFILDSVSSIGCHDIHTVFCIVRMPDWAS